MWYLNLFKVCDFFFFVIVVVILYWSFLYFEYMFDLGDVIFMWGVYVSYIFLNVDSFIVLLWFFLYVVLYIECMFVLVVDVGSKIGVFGKLLVWGMVGSGRLFFFLYFKIKFIIFLILLNFKVWFGFFFLFLCDFGMGLFCLRWCVIFFNFFLLMLWINKNVCLYILWLL